MALVHGGEVDHVDALGARQEHLVTARVDDVLGARLQGTHQGFGGAMVAQCHVEALVGEVALLDCDVER